MFQLQHIVPNPEYLSFASTGVRIMAISLAAILDTGHSLSGTLLCAHSNSKGRMALDVSPFWQGAAHYLRPLRRSIVKNECV